MNRRLGLGERSAVDRLRLLDKGDVIYIETTPDRYAHTQRTALVPLSRRPADLAGREFSVSLYTAVPAGKVGGVIYLVRLERIA